MILSRITKKSKPKYDVIRKRCFRRLVTVVNDKLQDGWHPQGGFCCDGRWYYQAIIKK